MVRMSLGGVALWSEDWIQSFGSWFEGMEPEETKYLLSLETFSEEYVAMGLCRCNLTEL